MTTGPGTGPGTGRADHGRDVLRLLDVSQRLERDRRTQRALILLLAEAGYGVRELARLSGYSAAQISRVTSGKSKAWA